MNIITDEKEITPMLIEEILHQTKSLERVEVKEIKKRGSTTLTSNIYFLDIKYSNNSPKSAPKKLFLKVSKKESFFSLGGRKEVYFYNSIAHKMGNISVVTCYDAKFDEKIGRSHILLKDISNTHFQAQYPIPPINMNCEKKIEALARLHAFWHEDARLGEFMSEIQVNKNFNYEKDLRKQKDLVHKFLEFISDRISESRQDIVRNSVEFALKYRLDCFKEGKNLTLIHNDTHDGNTFYPKDVKNGKIYFIDWGGVSIFKGVYDLAYFMGVHWYPNRRKRLEKVLLRKYHKFMVELGVKNYSWEECFNDYRSCIIYHLIGTIVWQWSTQKVPAIIWWYHLERALSAFEDLNCNELVKLK